MSFKCRYKSMGLKECAETPGLYACSPCREMAAFERDETTAASAGPLGELRDMSAEERARMIGVIDRTLSQRAPLQEYLASIERDILAGAGMPIIVHDNQVDAVKYSIKPGWHRLVMEEPRYLGPCECGRPIYGTATDRGRKCEVCRETEPKPPIIRECSACLRPIGETSVAGHPILGDHVTREGHRCHKSGTLAIHHRPTQDGVPYEPLSVAEPPTLREWLGDRASDLPLEWLAVLRDQPVQAGWIKRWEWVWYQGAWCLNAHGKPGTPSGIAEYAIVHAARGTTDRQWFPSWYDDGILMGCFTRRPSVPPEPRPVRTWFGNEEEP